ncbi:MAG: class II aldolase/adducin family protein [Gammaproteobacteria bacterium]|nr:class II aldolase/adducin family protein [Gammaproteobacteria bacterium]MCZ6826939.1 class II aldolase/adducin family protein [Gammaproteobacteria bacterium]MCZ6879716.1 class II aldolase/adducin family protein [Gammaproteobacteria bacterium]
MNAKDELVRYYRWLRQYGLNDSHSGNASIRIDDAVWVTPGGCCADTLVAEDLVRCALDGDPSDGASLDAPLHLSVYRRSPATAAILHSHGPHCIALTLDGQELAPRDFEGAYYFDHVPLLDIEYRDYLAESPTAVSEALSHARIAIVKGHGVYAHGENLGLAYKWTCALEASARIIYLASQNTPARES